MKHYTYWEYITEITIRKRKEYTKHLLDIHIDFNSGKLHHRNNNYIGRSIPLTTLTSNITEIRNIIYNMTNQTSSQDLNIHTDFNNGKLHQQKY